jgi:predicted GIY-YIG superfamily endonuclease
MADVYLLHFDKPYWRNCQHYIGYTKFTAEERITKHREGNGSKLVAYALRKGCDFTISLIEHYNTPEEARIREQQIKNRGHFDRLCIACRQKVCCETKD